MEVGDADHLESKAVRGATVVGFADLGIEAVCECEVKDMSVTVAVGSDGSLVHKTGPASGRLGLPGYR
jgi:fumarate hydratase class I